MTAGTTGALTAAAREERTGESWVRLGLEQIGTAGTDASSIYMFPWCFSLFFQ